jgi:hypothetical protein
MSKKDAIKKETFKLNVDQRGLLLSIFRTTEGDHVQMFRLRKLIEKIDFSDAELGLLRENKVDQVEEIEIELTEFGVERLQEIVKSGKNLRASQTLFEVYDIFKIEDPAEKEI